SAAVPAPGGSCQAPQKGPSVPCPKRGTGTYNIGFCPGFAEIATHFHIDMIAAAFRCDLTRVATMNWHKGTSEQIFPWLGIPNIGHHTFSHFPLSDIIAMGNLAKIGAWHHEMLARLYAQLDAYKYNDGTSM